MQARGGKLITSPWRRHDTPTSLGFYLNNQPSHEFEASKQNRKWEKRKRKKKKEKGKEEQEEKD